jgi:hypothetical protein
MIPEADYPIAVNGELAAPALIPSLVQGMLAAVEFNNQLAGRAGEVGNVRPDRMLPSELVLREGPALEVRPDSFLGISHVPPESPREAS